MDIGFNSRPLQYSSKKIEKDEPFVGDVFGNRARIATQLIQYIDRLNDGCVISINSKWGNGKTWFAENFINYLTSGDSENRKIVYIDAFRRDYIDDPFVMICGELAPIFDEGNSDFKSKSQNVLKAISTPAVRLLMNYIGKVTVGEKLISTDEDGLLDKLYRTISSSFDDEITRQLDEYDKQKSAVDGFKSVLEEESRKQDKPIIIIIDELDRCRPDFALKTIERVKHFFDIKKLVFILMVNKEQLEANVRSVYGEAIDATDYLDKFIHLSLNLSRQDMSASRGDAFKYCVAVASSLGLMGEAERFNSEFAAIARICKLSLREIERGYSLCALADNIRVMGGLLAWAILIKLKKQDIFSGLIVGDASANKRAYEFINSIPRTGLNSIEIMIDLHRLHIHGGALQHETTLYLHSMTHWRGNPLTIIPHLCRSVDFSID